MARVLRAEPGQQYEVSDGACVYLAEIAAVEKERVIFRVVEALDTPPAPVRLTLFAAIVTGQMFASLAFDQFGWFGLTPRPIDLTRVLGAVLLVGGVVLIRR